MSFTQRQKALDMLREIRERGGPELRPGLNPNPRVATRTPAGLQSTTTSAQKRLQRAVLSLFTKLKNQEVDADAAEQLVDECIDLFESDKRQVEKLCTGSHELADVRAAWTRQTQTVVEALDEALFIFFEDGDSNALARPFHKIKGALQERVPYYARLQQASSPEEQVA